MIASAEKIKAEAKSCNDANVTKSGTGTSTESGEKLIVPDWAYSYVDQYLLSGDFCDWGLFDVCKDASNNETLTYEQKIYIAQMLGIIDFIKDEAYSYIVATKSISLVEDDCLAVYKYNVKEILRTDILCGAAGGGAVGGIIGGLLGVIVGELQSLRGIREAGAEYVRCCAR